MICIHTNDKTYRLQATASAISEATKPHPDALGGRIWDTPILYWKRESSYRFIDDATMDKIIGRAFLEASIMTPLKIRKKNRSMSDAQIVINWLGKKDDPYFTSPSTLAYGYGPSSGLGGNITMNSDVLWLLRKEPLTAKEAKDLGYIENYANPANKIKFFDPIHTLKHEGGHALGMKHIEAQSQANLAVMYPFYNGLRTFGEADLAYLASLYGSVTLPRLIINQILAKITG